MQSNNPFRKAAIGRKPTTSAYGLTATSSIAPRPQEKVNLTIRKDETPSYAFADKQQGAVDTEAESKGQEDEKIREQQGKNPRANEQPQTEFIPPTHVVEKNDKVDQPHTLSSLGSPDYQMFWALETDFDMEEVTYTTKNTWTPNSFALFEILDAAGRFVYDNRVVTKHHPEYLDYAVACYYAIIFYIQILRAKNAAGLLIGQDASFLRRFERKFKPEELPISRIVFPFFSTIVSTLLPDSKYGWITPEINAGMFIARMTDYGQAAHTSNNGANFLQPNVPYMLAILREAISRDRQNHLSDSMATHYGAGEAGNDDPAFFNDFEEYVPVRLSANAHTTLFGIRFQIGTVRTDDRNTLLTTAGVSHPFHADYDQLTAAAPKWRKTSFMTMDLTEMANGTRMINDLESFLHMDKKDDMEWFRELILQAATHARFFGAVKNLSDVPQTGGMETLIGCMHKKKTAAGAAIHYDDIQLGLRPSPVTLDWYPRTFRDTVGSFYTTRNGLKRQETLQSLTFAPNASIFVGTKPDRVGEGAAFRTGPYWNNKEWTSTRFEDSGTQGKPMFRGWQTMIQGNAALVKPAGY